jgi:hypothetical protein
VPHFASEPIIFYTFDGVVQSECQLPKSPDGHTDFISHCETNGDRLLLTFTDGAVFLIDPSTLHITQVLRNVRREGAWSPEYPVADFFNKRSLLVAYPYSGKVKVICIESGASKLELDVADRILGANAFSNHGLSIVRGPHTIYMLDNNELRIVNKYEMPNDIVELSCARNGRVFSVLEGELPYSSHMLEVFDLMSAEAILRRRSTNVRGWGSVALSNSGRAIAATQGAEFVLFERGA